MGSFSDFFTGSQGKMKPFNKQALQQLMQLIQNGGGLNQSSLYGSGSNFLQSILSNQPGAFESFEAPYKEQFEQQTVPMIAERFAGMGTGGGASSSSGLQQALAQAGKGLSTNLAALRGGLQMQAAPQALAYSQQPIQNLLQALGLIPGQYYEQPGQGGFLQGGLNSFMHGMGQNFGF